ncbi:MAG: hypothetical protein RML36_14855 [Anaerolineae bacterium]|nr:hypothetical protein [Anaerolineae bacterium]MDW8100751.1 hypothetical protein [Anaerolineae bacterium]
MVLWRVVCVKRMRIRRPVPHIHIAGVGTGDRADWADMRWTLGQVLRAMDDGEVFYTQDDATGQIRLIERYLCPHCQRIYIRSAEGIPEANLDDLRSCIYE